jgi:hypothetical protein
VSESKIQPEIGLPNNFMPRLNYDSKILVALDLCLRDLLRLALIAIFLGTFSTSHAAGEAQTLSSRYQMPKTVNALLLRPNLMGVGNMLKEYTVSGSLSVEESKKCDSELKQIEFKIKALVDQGRQTPDGLALNLGDQSQELSATSNLLGSMGQLKNRMLVLAAKKNGESASSVIKDELIEAKLKSLKTRMDSSLENNSIGSSDYHFFEGQIKRFNGVMKTLASQARHTPNGPQMNGGSLLAVHRELDGLSSKLDEIIARRKR